MANELTTGGQTNVSIVIDHPLGELIKPLSHEIHLFDSRVAGTSYIQDQSVFETIKEGDTILLQREPENRFDENAILVLDSQRRKLGYIPEKDNIVFTRLMDAGKYLTAKVKYFDAGDAFKMLTISIYLVDF